MPRRWARVKLVDAIAALHSGASGKARSDDTATGSSSPSAANEDRAERRQITVMFSDLVGSTAVAERRIQFRPKELKIPCRPSLQIDRPDRSAARKAP